MRKSNGPFATTRRGFLTASVAGAASLAASRYWTSVLAGETAVWDTSPWPEGFARERITGQEFTLAADGRAAADIVLLGGAADELVRNAADWIGQTVQRRTGATIRVGGESLSANGNRRVVAVVGEHPMLGRLAERHQLRLPMEAGSQGYVIQRVADDEAGDLLICWSPASLGCRYGLIDLLRQLECKPGGASVRVQRITERPQFPVRICYVNFAEHLQNAFNPNLLFDVPTNRWTTADWERFIDMVSAMRFNVFEFWLVPTLFSRESLQGGHTQREFAKTMSHVIAYAKRRGVTVHPIQAVNTVGGDWHYHCPHLENEHQEIVALWDHWSKSLEGLESMGLFPGDPGGCTKNGCTAETYVDLCLELAATIRKNRPRARIEVGTWGDPFAGWGVGLWTGKPDRAATAMDYFLKRLPEFPPDTFTSINLGFSPDCQANSHGGDGAAYAKRAAAQNRAVLTWDYSVTEGEGTVSPRCRVRRMLARRQEEQAIGCYSGGICYTMAPKLQLVSMYGCAEAFWNPSQTPDGVLRDFGRLVFGAESAEIGPLLEEFEVIPDWGHYPPFPYSPQRLNENMARLGGLLRKIDASQESVLPLATPLAEYRDHLVYFAELFDKLSRTAMLLSELNSLAEAAGRESAEPISMTEAESILSADMGAERHDRMRDITKQLRDLDVRGLMKEYWRRVYGIYDQIPHPVDPRAQGAATALFNRFQCRLAMVAPPSPIEPMLQATEKPYVLVQLGDFARPGNWEFSGWTLHGEEGGESWSASFESPGVISCNDFKDRGYRWLILRLTEGPKGTGKTILVNEHVVGEFERTGPPLEVRKEWWVTRCYPLPAGLLKDGALEICFKRPGIAISAVALATEPISSGQAEQP